MKFNRSHLGAYRINEKKSLVTINSKHGIEYQATKGFINAALARLYLIRNNKSKIMRKQRLQRLLYLSVIFSGIKLNDFDLIDSECGQFNFTIDGGLCYNMIDLKTCEHKASFLQALGNFYAWNKHDRKKSLRLTATNFPIELDSSKWHNSLKTATLWLNPERWEYIDYLIDMLEYMQRYKGNKFVHKPLQS